MKLSISLGLLVAASAEQLSCEAPEIYRDGIWPPLPQNYNNSKFAGMHFPVTAMPEPYASNKIMKKFFSHYTSVFGIPIFANSGIEKNGGLWKVNHVANVLAQWLDNDMDGKPDDPNIASALQGKTKNHGGGFYSMGAIVMFHSDQDPAMDEFLRNTPDQFNVYWKDVDGTDITGDDDGNALALNSTAAAHNQHKIRKIGKHHTRFIFVKEPQGSLKKRGCDPTSSVPLADQIPARPWYDGAYEEPVHLMNVQGWVTAYPKVWAQGGGPSGGDDDFDDDNKAGLHKKWESESWHLCIKAVGDCGWAYNHTYKFPKCTGHYHYDDDSCDVLCQCTEMIYWSLTSLIGLQDFPGNKDDCAGEWDSNTPSLMREHLPEYVALLQNRSDAGTLPKKPPNGVYKVADTTEVLAPVKPQIHEAGFEFHLNQKYF
jgi:hypothetical protein